MSLKIFAQEFKEENWRNFVSFSQENYQSLSISLINELDNLLLPDDVKVVLGYRLGDYAKEWLNKELLIIGGIKPRDLLKTEEGQKALKEILLRLPD